MSIALDACTAASQQQRTNESVRILAIVAMVSEHTSNLGASEPLLHFINLVPRD